jgi:DNA-binding GntR family transcriptional regulator
MATRRTSKKATAKKAAKGSSQPLLMQAYEGLRSRIIAGSLPPGMRLDYQKLAVELGLSTTPVREAMGHLASEGFVELIPRLGAVVKQLARQDLIDLFGVREAIETYAAARVAGRLSSRRIEQMEALWQGMEQAIAQLPETPGAVLSGAELGAWLERDRAFHLTMINAMENDRLSKLASDGQLHLVIFNAAHSGHTRALLVNANREHRAILDALKSGDALEASRLIGEHVRNSLEGKLENLRAPHTLGKFGGF